MRVLQHIKRNSNRIKNGVFAAFFAVFAFQFLTHVTQAATDLQPGEVRTAKTATAVPGMLNTWDINLKIEARDDPKTSDTVIVVDRSYSMTQNGSCKTYKSNGRDCNIYNTKLDDAKSAANNFIDKLLPQGTSATNKIAIVQFGTGADKLQATFTNNATSLKSTVNGITSPSQNAQYTNTQLGLKYAEDIIATSQANIKNIVFLSDGEPTRSMGVGSGDTNNDICSNFTTYVSGGETKTNIPSNLYNYSRTVGSDATGLSGSMQCTGNRGTYKYNHANNAIAEAGFAKGMTQQPTLYTIALTAGTVGEDTLRAMASADSYYKGTADDLQAIFNKIAGNILAAAKNVSISDTVANNFAIISYTTGGIETGQTVSWNNVELDTVNGDVRSGTMTIRVQLKTGDTTTTSQTATNTAVEFKYTDANGLVKTQSPASPQVHPVHAHVQLIIDGPKANPSDAFNVSVSNGGANYGNNFGNVSSSSTTNYNPDRPLETGNYTISQTITGGGQYDTTYQYKIGDGSWKTTTSITEITAAYQAYADAHPDQNNDLYVKVTNKAKIGSLTISKSLGDCTNLTLPAVSFDAKVFNFQVKNSAGTVVASPEITVSNINCPATITVSNLAQGVYTVTELGAMDYTTTPSKEQTVTVGLTGSLNPTVNFKNVFSKKTTVTAQKIWLGGVDSEHKTTFTVTRGDGTVVKTEAVNGDQSFSWELPAGDQYGNPYTYTVSEAPIAHYNLARSGNVFTNTYESPIRDVTATKNWVNGPNAHPTVQFELYRKVGSGAEVKVTDAVTKTLANGTTSVTWTDMSRYNGDGLEYTYLVHEVAEPTNYTKSESGLAVTNTYHSPKSPITATKVWEHGANATRPTIKFELHRSVNGANDEIVATQTVPGSNTVNFGNQDTYDIQGNAYAYYVVELNADGTPFAHDNYTKSESGLTVTNTYQSGTRTITVHKDWNGGVAGNRTASFTLTGGEIVSGNATQTITETGTASWTVKATDLEGNLYDYSVTEAAVDGYAGSWVNSLWNVLAGTGNASSNVTNTYQIPHDGTFTINKIWSGGEAVDSVRPDVTFTLKRKIGTNVDATYSQSYTLTNGTLTHTFTGLDTTNFAGEAYTYYAEEINVPTGYTSAVTSQATNQSVTVTNTYVVNKTTVGASKEWVNGDANSRPTVYFQLWRQITGGTKQQVGSPVVVPAEDLATHKAAVGFGNQDATDAAGNTYAYTVTEVTSEGVDLTPEHYTKSESGLTVTNTYTSPETSFTATKVWAGGPATHPTIKLQLMRDGADFGGEVSLANGTTQYTWDKLEQTDTNGVAYVYTVKEVGVPTNYTMSQTGNTITNTYQSPPRTISATKVWDGGQASTHTTRFTLSGGPNTITDRTKSVTGGMTVTWGVPANDSNGNPYSYSVSEESVANYLADCDTSCPVDENGNVTMTNTYVSPKTEVTALKHWVNGSANRPQVKLQLVRNTQDVSGAVVTLDGTAGWSYTWTDLDKTDHDGNDYVYTVREVDVPANYSDTYSENKLEVTNTYVIPTDGVATATKTWIHGDKLTRPTIYFQLYRAVNGGAAEVVPGAAIKQLASGTTQVTWTDLETTDSNGNPYAFSVRELDAEGYDSTPANYTRSEDGLNVTNTYISPEISFTVSKIWVGGPAVRPSIQVQLYQNGVALGAPITLTNGQTTFTWNGLDLTDSDGTPYVYTVSEVGMPTDYRLVNNRRTDDGAELTNSYIDTPGKGGAGGGTPPVRELPATGPSDTNRNPLVIFLAGLATYGTLYVILPRNRRDEA